MKAHSICIIMAVSFCAANVETAFTGDSELKVVLELSDGSVIIGKPSEESIQFRTEEEAHTIKLQQLLTGRIEEGNWILFTEQSAGGRLDGSIVTETLKLNSLIGPVTVPLRHAVKIETIPAPVDLDLPARDALVLYFNFDRDTGPRLRNLASFRHHAIVRGATWTPEGKHRGAMEFKGNSYVEIPHHEELGPETLTFAAWVYSTNPTGPWRLLMSKTNTGSWYGGYGFCRYSGNDENLYFYAGNYYSIAAKQRMPQDQWVHIAGVFDGKKVMLYLNGEPSLPVELPDQNGPIRHTTTSLIIGGAGDYQAYDWVGKIDDVMLFRRALSAAQIEQLMTIHSPHREKPAPAE